MAPSEVFAASMGTAPMDFDITSARLALQRGDLSASDLLELCIERIEATDATLRAWVHLDLAAARSESRKIEQGDPRPLAGIPLGIKDLIDVAGMPTTASSQVLSGNIAAADAPVVSSLRRAGAVVIGKTNTQEFAYGFVTPPTTNPWDSRRIPGGSSGGSAAAVAGGHVPAALGTDTGGSIRVPAALCGVCGLKPRPGIAPMEGIVPLAPGYDVVGPIARNAEDLATLWEAITTSPRPPAAKGGFTMGLPPRSALPELDPGIAELFDAAISDMESAGGVAKEVSIPSFEAFDGPRAAVLMTEALRVHREMGWWPNRADKYTEETRALLSAAEAFDPERVEAGRAEARRLSSLLLGAVEQVDVLLSPTCSVPAPTHEFAALVEEGSLRKPVATLLARLAGPVNLAGLAAATVPCGLCEDGLPAGIQLIGTDEWRILEVAERYQRATAHHLLRPRS